MPAINPTPKLTDFYELPAFFHFSLPILCGFYFLFSLCWIFGDKDGYLQCLWSFDLIVIVVFFLFPF